MNKIIEALAQARKQQRLSQAVLGQKLGMPQSHISKIEKGDVDLRLSSLVDMARLLGLELMLVPKAYAPIIQHMTTHTGVQEEELSLPELLLIECNEELE
jgi:HTH-type transcriptional regulator/antitoxin HipB